MIIVARIIATAAAVGLAIPSMWRNLAGGDGTGGSPLWFWASAAAGASVIVVVWAV